MSSESGEVENGNERNSKHLFKLVWWEDDTKSCVSWGIRYGECFWIDTASGLLHFSGSKGDVMLPIKTMKFVLK